MSRIHPSAIVDLGAEVGSECEIAPYVVIEAGVKVGDQCSIGAHSVLKRYTRIGACNRIAEHVIIGGEPQDLSFQACESYVDIGERNVIREGVTIHRATGAGNTTTLGDGNYLMANSHIAHECSVGNQVVFANGVALAGHVSIGDHAFLSAYVSIHQFCRIGSYAMISGLSGINQDCLPFITSAGIPARPLGLNLVGLRRAGFDRDTIRELKNAYQVLLRSGLPLKTAIEQLSVSDCEQVQELVAFVRSSKRRGFTHQRN